MRLARCMIALTIAAASVSASAQGWAPQKNVEIVAGSAPGGSNDKTARMLERLLSQGKLVPTSMTVVNKAGGGGTIAYTYVAQHAKDPHYIGVTGGGLFSNQILGVSPLTLADFTPIANLVNDYAVFAVSTGSAIKTGKDLADRLRKDPRSLNLGFANAFGSTRHIAAGMLIKALGGNPRDLKPVVFKGSAEAITALLGNHLEYVVVGATNTTVHIASGRMRVVAVAAPKRLGGPLSDVPTWREQGVDMVSGSWRGIFAPKGLTPAQIAFWENALVTISKTAEWKADVEKNYWTEDVQIGAEFRKLLDEEYKDTKAILSDLGLVK